MSDIDYDELDRAVNSLANQPAASTPAPQATAPNSPDSTSGAPQVKPDTQPVASRRSSGRFMDVVHPSSDMRPVTVPPRASSREASPLQPPGRAQIQPDVPAKDLQTSSPAESTMPVAVDSPFLPDTKVEKRPLGAFTDVEAQEPTSPDFSIKPVAEPDRPIESDTPLPRELQDDLLTVETNEEAPTSQAVESEKAAASQPNSAPIAPASILQQYVEKTDKVEPPTTSIFDVGSYQKTVGSKKKKKSGWLVVLWIVLLVIVGAGAGAAVYFYVLPLL